MLWKGATLIVALIEDGLRTCSPIPVLAEQYNLNVLNMTTVPTAPTLQHLEEAATQFASIIPNVVVTCIYDNGCSQSIHAMRNVNWSPKAQIFMVCIGMAELEVGTNVNDKAYMMGAASWNRIIESKSPDAVTGWTPQH